MPRFEHSMDNQRGSTRTEHPENLEAKLSREANLFGSLKDNLWNEVSEHLKNNKTSIVAETAGAVMLGAGMAALSRKPVLLGETLAPVIKAAIPMAGKAGLGLGVADWGLRLGLPAYDTWQESTNLEVAKKRLARNVGAGLVDFTAMGLGGAVGGGLGLKLTSEVLRSTPFSIAVEAKSSLSNKLAASKSSSLKATVEIKTEEKVLAAVSAETKTKESFGLPAEPFGNFQDRDGSASFSLVHRFHDKFKEVKLPADHPVTATVSEKVKGVVQIATFRSADGRTGKWHQGSGFVVPDGRIATAAHVVRDVGKGHVILRSEAGDLYQAEVQHVDPENDLAVLRLVCKQNPNAPKELPGLHLAHGNSSTVGEQTLSLGFPGNDKLTIAVGKVENAGRREEIFSAKINGHEAYLPTEVIKLDSGVVGGMSGGPVFRLSDGQVIGVSSFGDPFKTGAVPIAKLQALLTKGIARSL